jgi:hypothetical protein
VVRGGIWAKGRKSCNNPSVRPIAAALTSREGDAGQLRIASLPAATAILGCNSMFSPLHPKSQVNTSRTSWA